VSQDGHPVIISHSRRFIFVKTSKTAGSSLELALSLHCADGDVLTPLLPPEDALRARIGGVPPQNFGRPARGVAGRLRQVLRRRSRPRFHQHMEAWQIKREVGEEVWNDYFTFAVVRNPFDRLVRTFYFADRWNRDHNIKQHYEYGNFDQFIRYNPDTINDNWRIYTQDDRPLVDFLVRYEALEHDLGHVSERIGLDHNLYDDMKSMQAKAGVRPSGAKPETLLDDRHRALVSILCEKEIQLIGYDRDPRSGSAYAAAPERPAVNEAHPMERSRQAGRAG
jgi:hypothetical protein